MGEKKLLYYIFIITILAVGGISYFFVVPLVKKIDSAKKEQQSKKAELRMLEKKEEDLKELDLNYKNFKEQIDMIAEMLPKTKEVSDYITQLENAAGETAVSLESIKISSQPSGQTKENTKEQTSPELTQLIKSGDIYELPIDITINSDSFENILDFVKTVENLSRFGSIKKTSIKIESGDTLKGSISLNIYVLP